MQYIQYFSTLTLAIFLTNNIQAHCWNLVFEEEFNGTSLDLNTWEYQIGAGGWGNAELQYYTNGANVDVSNGTLKIIAQKSGNTYTSSRIRTKDKADFRYGRLEARIKLPIGQGIWPAFWMMPTDDVYGTWPSSGEIDIMEYLGNDANTIYGTCHYGYSPGDKGYLTGSYDLASGGFNDDFHVFAVEWEDNVIRWYMDGQLYHAVSSSHPEFNYFNWPFTEDFHFILNVAVGGLWPGYPDATTVFPQTMEVDWVRVYQELPDIQITGASLLQPYSATQTYAVSEVAGANYTWSVPADAQIVSGQGTNEITVSFGGASGDISVDVNTPCGAVSQSLYADISPNVLANYNFENGNENWTNNQFNGAYADFNLDNTQAYEGSTAMCVDVQNIVANYWEIQLGRTDISLIEGEHYTLSFWAKADQNGKDLDLSFIHPTNYSTYIYENVVLTNQWAQYSIEFTSPVTLNVLFNIDLGDELGETCFDDFSFSKTALVAPHLTGISDCLTLMETPNEGVFHIVGLLDQYVIQILDTNESLISSHINVGNSFSIDTNQLSAGMHFVRVINLSNGAVLMQQNIKE